MPSGSEAEYKAALEVMKQSHAGQIESARRYAKQFRRERKSVRDVLAEGPATVPEIAARTALPANVVLWHIAAMIKYGQVREDQQEGDYIKYAFIEGSTDQQSNKD